MNNTSVILLLTVGERRLLFPGDAQIESWSLAPRAVRLRAFAVRPAACHLELGQLEGVDVQQRAGLGPLIAPRALRAALRRWRETP